MRTVLFALVLGFLLLGCGGPSAPSSVQAQGWTPLHHGIIATFVGHPEGPLVYLCATQPRSVTLPSDEVVLEEDHYLQYEPCPQVPIP